MRTLTMMTTTLGILAFGFTAQAGPFMNAAKPQQEVSAQSTLVAKYVVPGCWIKKTLKYDYHGNPYLKKVRVCA